MQRVPYYLLLTLCLIFTSCDSDSNDDDGGNGGNGGGELGNFSATLGGDLSGSFNGNAFFSVVQDPELPVDRAFVLIMTDIDITSGNTNLTEWVAIVRPGDRPGEGTYDIDVASDEFDGTFAFYFNAVNQSSGQTLQGATGTLRITDSSSDRVQGSFEFSGDLIDFSNPQTIGSGSISGTFNAAFVDPNTTPTIPTLQDAAEND